LALAKSLPVTTLLAYVLHYLIVSNGLCASNFAEKACLLEASPIMGFEGRAITSGPRAEQRKVDGLVRTCLQKMLISNL